MARQAAAFQMTKRSWNGRFSLALSGGRRTREDLNMKRLVLTAATLLAGTALAAAQGMNPPNKAEGAAPAPAAQQKAPAEKTAPHAQAAPHQTTGQAPKAEDSKAGAQMNTDASKGADVKAKGSMRKDDKAAADNNKSRMSNDKAAQEKSGKDENKASAQSDTKGKTSTTGQGAAGARANLTTQEKTKIRTVFKEKVHVKPETHVNFSINVGTRVPRTIHYHTLPAEVVSVYPAWRGYYFILVNNEIVVIEPSTFEIVAVIA
jgi:hypothetical protein